MSRIQWTKGPELNAEFYYGNIHDVEKVFIVIGPSEKEETTWRLCSWFWENKVTTHGTKEEAIKEAEDIYSTFLENFGLVEAA